jgi:hypothetical protein
MSELPPHVPSASHVPFSTPPADAAAIGNRHAAIRQQHSDFGWKAIATAFKQF